LLDQLIGRLAKRGEVTLAGFYEAPLSFNFPPAFMREARIRIAAEWARSDIEAVTDLVATGRLSLAGLITNRASASAAPPPTARPLPTPNCIKMVLDWRTAA
jgi:bacteriochlorophyllide a dehydrogenase